MYHQNINIGGKLWETNNGNVFYSVFIKAYINPNSTKMNDVHRMKTMKQTAARINQQPSEN